MTRTQTGRLPATPTLTTAGSAATKYAYYALELDADYDLISLGMVPDPNSLIANFKAAAFTCNGGSQWGGKTVNGNFSEPTPPYSAATFWGSLFQRIIGDPTDPNGFCTLYGKQNPFMPGTPMRMQKGDILVLVAQVTPSNDSVSRAVMCEIVAFQAPADTSHS
jgi:hypothetical protein